MRPIYPAPTAIPPRPSRRQIPPYMIVLLIAGGLGFGFLAVLVLAVAIVVGGVYASDSILPGVTVDGSGINAVSVGNMPVEEAAAKLYDLPVERTITLRDGSRTWDVSAADLGISLDAGATASKAAEAGREDGSIFTGIGAMLGGATVSPVYTVDLARAQATLTSLADKFNVEPGANGDVKAAGRTLNAGATLDRLPGDLATLLDSGALDLVMDVIEGPRTIYTVQRGEELGLIAKKFNVAVSDIVAMNNLESADVIYPGQQLIIPAAGIWVPTEKDAPPAPLASGKSIVVNLRTQRIYAYQNGRLVHSSLMSSGRPGTETVQGDYKIYVKYASTRMRGPDYDLPNVPWTMYFYKGYGIHGAYWHNNFGRVMSHGCVNLEASEAKWYFDFAPVGTLVRVIPA